MNTKIILLISTVIALIGVPGAFAISDIPISNEIKLDIGDNGSTVELNKGQVLVISLESNPSTGFTWEVAELDTHILHQIGETEFQPGSNAPGAPGMQILRFEAENAGQTPLKLVYHRPFETDMPPLRTFSIQVIVRPVVTPVPEYPSLVIPVVGVMGLIMLLLYRRQNT